MNGTESGHVLVQVVDVEEGREIGWGANLAEQIGDRSEDIQLGITAGAKMLADSLGTLQDAQGWRLGQVTASFGVALTAEAGVLISKASAEATFEITVSYHRDQSKLDGQ